MPEIGSQKSINIGLEAPPSVVEKSEIPQAKAVSQATGGQAGAGGQSAYPMQPQVTWNQQGIPDIKIQGVSLIVEPVPPNIGYGRTDLFFIKVPEALIGDGANQIPRGFGGSPYAIVGFSALRGYGIIQATGGGAVTKEDIRSGTWGSYGETAPEPPPILIPTPTPPPAPTPNFVTDPSALGGQGISYNTKMGQYFNTTTGQQLMSLPKGYVLGSWEGSPAGGTAKGTQTLTEAQKVVLSAQAPSATAPTKQLDPQTQKAVDTLSQVSGVGIKPTLDTIQRYIANPFSPEWQGLSPANLQALETATKAIAPNVAGYTAVVATSEKGEKNVMLVSNATINRVLSMPIDSQAGEWERLGIAVQDQHRFAMQLAQRQQYQAEIANIAKFNNITIANPNKLSDAEIVSLIKAGVNPDTILNAGGATASKINSMIKQTGQQAVEPIAMKRGINKDPNFYTQSDVEAMIKDGAKAQDLVNAGVNYAIVKSASDKIVSEYETNVVANLPNQDLKDAYYTAKKSGNFTAYDSILNDYNAQIQAKSDAQKKSEDILTKGGYGITKQISPRGTGITPAGEVFPSTEALTVSSGYNIGQYLIDTKTSDYKVNPASLAVLQSIYKLEQIAEVSKKVQDNLTAIKDTIGYLGKVASDVKQEVYSPLDYNNLLNGLIATGHISKPDIAKAVIPFTKGIDYKDIWDKLSDREKEIVAQHVIADPNKSSTLASFTESYNVIVPSYVSLPLAFVSPVGMPLLAGQALANVIAPYTITNQAIASQIKNNTDYFKGASSLSPTESKSLSDAMKNVGASVSDKPLVDYQELDVNTQQKVISELTRQQLGLEVSTMQKVMAGGMVVASALPYVGGVATGLASRLGLLATQAGISGVFIVGSVPIILDPKASISDKATAIGFDALMLAGLARGIKGANVSVADRVAIDSAKSINEALRPTKVDAGKPLTTIIGEAISDVKTEVKDIPNKVYTAPEAVKYYAQGLKIDLGELVNAIKTNIEQAQMDRASRVVKEIVDQQLDIQARKLLSDTGVLQGDIPATLETAKGAIKYYGVEVGRAFSNAGKSATEAMKSAYGGLIEARQAEANKVIQAMVDKEAQRILSGVGKGEFATLADAIKYYGEEVKRVATDSMKSIYSGLSEAEQARADKMVKDYIDRQNEILYPRMTKGAFTTTAEAIKYYGAEIGRAIANAIKATTEAMKSTYDSMLEAKQAEANKVVENYLKKETERLSAQVGQGDLATLRDAIKYYTDGVKMTIGDAMKSTGDAFKSALENYEKIRMQQAQRMVDDITTRGLVESVPEKSILSNLPQMLKYYAQGLILETSAKGKLLADQVSYIFRDISEAMKARDRDTITRKAEQLEMLSAEFDDGKAAEWLKKAAQSIKKNVDSYIKSADSIKPEDIAKVDEVVKAGEELVKQTYNDLVNSTRALKLEDIARDIREGRVSKEVIDIASKNYDYLGEIQRQKNLERLTRVIGETTANDVQTYLDAQSVRNENIPKLDRASKDLTMQDMQTYLDALKVRAKNLEGLNRVIVEETINDLETFMKARTSLEKPISFITELGSEYKVEGTKTTRYKAEGIHEGDFGLKPQSEKTYYLTNEQYAKLGSMAEREVSTYELPNGDLVIRGKLPNGELYDMNIGRVATTPEVGLRPLEKWANVSHFGHKIISVERGLQQVIPQEGASPYKPLDPAQQGLMDAINRDTLKLNEYQNVKGMEFESNKLFNRIQENVTKLAQLSGQDKPFVNLIKILETKLKELGYTDKEIAEMSGMEKVKKVANETPPEKLTKKLEEELYPPERGGGARVAVEEKVEVKPKTAEELEKELLKEKPAEAKPEVKPEEKSKIEAKPTEKGRVGIATEEGVIVPTPEGKPTPSDLGLISFPSTQGRQAFIEWLLGTMVRTGYAYAIDPKTGQIVSVPATEAGGRRGITITPITTPLTPTAPIKAPIVIPIVAPVKQPDAQSITEQIAKIQDMIRQAHQLATQNNNLVAQQQAQQASTLISQAQQLSQQQKYQQAQEIAQQAQTLVETTLAQPQPVPTPTPQPMPQPIPQPQPMPAPEKPPPPPPKEILIPPPLPPTGEGVGKKPVEIPYGALTHRQGNHWGYITREELAKVSPQKEIIWLRDGEIPVGIYKYAEGKGSAYKTLQILPKGATLPTDHADVDMGWATIHITQEPSGELKMEYLGGKEAADQRWEEERVLEAQAQAIAKASVMKYIPSRESDVEQIQAEAVRQDQPYKVQQMEGGEYEEQKKQEEASYKKIYDDLVEVARQKGFKVVDVPHEQLHDYAAMQPIVAKKIGYPMPDNEIHMNIKWNEDIKEKSKNLKHELEEIEDMAKGTEYWDAHVEATKNESELDEVDKDEVLVPSHYRHKPIRMKKPRNFEKVQRQQWGEEELEAVGATRKRKVIEADSSGIRHIYYLGRKLSDSGFGEEI